MALRDKMAASAAPYMRPGEPVQAIFAGLWHQIPVGSEYLRVHRRFFKDIESSDATAVSTV